MSLESVHFIFFHLSAFFSVQFELSIKVLHVSKAHGIPGFA